MRVSQRAEAGRGRRRAALSIPRTSRRLAVTQAVIVVFVAVFATSALAATPTASNAPGALLGNSAPSWWINDYLGTSAKFTSEDRKSTRLNSSHRT